MIKTPCLIFVIANECSSQVLALNYELGRDLVISWPLAGVVQILLNLNLNFFSS